MKWIPRPLLGALCLALTAALVLSGAASAGSSADAEIDDDANDSTPLAQAAALGVDPSPAQEHASMFDITGAYVTGESSESFMLVLMVRDLDGGLSNAVDLGLLGDDRPYLVTDYHFRFAIHEKPYGAHARLTTFEAGGLEANYTLTAAAGAQKTLEGSVDLQANTVTVKVPKAHVDAPKPGEKLTQFWATSEVSGVLMDAAPDAEPTVTGEQPTDPTQVQPNFGADYEFGQYEGAWPPDFSIAIDGGGHKEVAPGATDAYAVRVTNEADKADAIQLVLTPVAGWTAQLAKTSVSLGPDSDTIVLLTVSPNSHSATQNAIFVLSGSSTLGNMEKSITVTATLKAPTTGGGGGSPGGTGTTGGGGGDPTGGTGTTGDGGTGDGDGPSSDGADGNASAGDGKKETPAVGAVAALAVLGVFVAASRRHG